MKVACTDLGMYRTDNKSWTDEALRQKVSYMELAVARLPEDEASLEELITHALRCGVSLNLHAPYGINNITSTDSARRMASIANVKRTIDLSAKYQLGTVTFHPGRLSDDGDDPESIWADMMEIVSDIVLYAKEKQVYIGIENMECRPYELVYTIDDLNRFAPLTRDNPFFGATIDFAHYASHGIGLPDLRALKLPLHDVHLSQIVDGKMHSALSNAEGTPHIASVCRLLADYGYDGPLVLEVTDRVWESAEILRSAIEASECGSAY